MGPMLKRNQVMGYLICVSLLGFLLRVLQLKYAFDEQGLMVGGNGSVTVLAVLSAIVVLVVALFCRELEPRPIYIEAFSDGILELLGYYKIETAGKHCVVIGRSNIVGRPIANLLSQKGWDCTVTLCHSRTKNLAEVVRGGDIVIAALGKAEFVTADMIKPGAVVVDVGITRVPSDRTKSGWKLLGDVKFDEVAPKCSYITPVPGGVGPMTIISLMKNTLKAGRGEVYGK